MASALSQKSSPASSATAANSGVIRTKSRKSRLGTPSSFAACETFPHDSPNTCFASSIEIFSQLEGILGVGYRGIVLAPQIDFEGGKDTPGAMPTHDGLGPAQ
jgi:hypothetical protein